MGGCRVIAKRNLHWRRGPTAERDSDANDVDLEGVDARRYGPFTDGATALLGEERSRAAVERHGVWSFSRWWLARAVVCAILASTVAATARADVVSVKLLTRALAATPLIKRDASLSGTLNGWPYYNVRGRSLGGFVADAEVDYGYASNGADLLIVPLESGGSGGVFTTLVFTSIRRHPRLVGTIASPGGHLSVFIRRGEVTAQSPVYGPDDPNCCPSALSYAQYAFDGLRLTRRQVYTLKLAK